MAFYYFYQFVPLIKEDDYARRPIVPVIINGYGFTGLLDSGSDAIVIPKEIAEALLLKKMGETELYQMDGNPLKCDLSEVEMEFGKNRESKKFKCRVLVSDSPRIILGRKNFFEHFKITFDESTNKIRFQIIEERSKHLKF